MRNTILSITRSRWFRYSAGFLFWTLVGLFFASQVYFISVYRGEPHPWQRTLLWTMPDWYTWAVLTPFILHLARRFRIGRPDWLKHLLIHLPASLGFALLHLAMYTPVQVYLNPVSTQEFGVAGMFQFYLYTRLHFNIVTYAVIIGIWHAFDYHRKMRDREMRMLQLETQLVQSHLKVLKTQLQPHFLFNTLNSISALIHTDPDDADRMVARLGDLLRATLQNEEAQFVSLERELDLLLTYLEIEQIRLADRLTVDLQIDEDTLEAEVPNFVMQPLAENAVKHGISPQKDSGTITISASRTSDRLTLRVHDNGEGMAIGRSLPRNGGVGLDNTRRRLAQLYGSDHELRVLSSKNGGFSVTISIPFRKHRASSLSPI